MALQLWRYYLRMLNHTFVEISFPQGFIFTKDVYLQSLLRLFDMEGLFVVFSSLSFDYLEWGRLIVCSIFFLCSWLDAISGTFRFLYHISLLSLLNMLLSRLFHMGEIDYLDDNPMKKHFSGKDLSIFSFILRWSVRL